MRIALFYNLPSGGAKRSVYEQATRLSQKHSIDLFSLRSANQEFLDIRGMADHVFLFPFQRAKLLKSPFGRLNQLSRWRELMRLDALMKKMAAQIDAGGYDLALVHQCQISYSPALLRYLKTPSLYYRHDMIRWMHDPELKRPNQSGVFHGKLDKIDPILQFYRRGFFIKDRINMEAASQLVTNSYFMRESLYRIYGITARVCYLGVDESIFRPFGNDHGDFVLSVGMIQPCKGYDFLIQSISEINLIERPNLVIVGNSSDENELAYLQNLADQRGVTVTFKQMIELNELIDLYRTARCLAYTPYLEPFGLVPLEAMACGTPVVGICEGGVRETILNGQTGFLVERDPAQFGQALMQLKDEKKRLQMSKQSRDYILEHWTIESSIQRLENEISRMVI